MARGRLLTDVCVLLSRQISDQTTASRTVMEHLLWHRIDQIERFLGGLLVKMSVCSVVCGFDAVPADPS